MPTTLGDQVPTYLQKKKNHDNIKYKDRVEAGGAGWLF